MVNLITWFENEFTTTEADVVAVIVQIKTGLQWAESEVNSGLKWVAANVPNIVTQMQGIVGIVQQLGVAQIPQVAAAITATQLAEKALQAFAAAENSGSGNAQALVNGYVAVKQAQAAAASAAAAAAAAPTSPVPKAA